MSKTTLERCAICQVVPPAWGDYCKLCTVSEILMWVISKVWNSNLPKAWSLGKGSKYRS